MKNVFVILIIMGVLTLADQEPISDDLFFYNPSTNTVELDQDETNLNQLSNLTKEIFESSNQENEEDEFLIRRNFNRKIEEE